MIIDFGMAAIITTNEVLNLDQELGNIAHHKLLVIYLTLNLLMFGVWELSYMKFFSEVDHLRLLISLYQ